jgi:hypothetical protein
MAGFQKRVRGEDLFENAAVIKQFRRELPRAGFVGRTL